MKGSIEVKKGGERIDVFVSKQLSISRAYTQHLIKEGMIKIDGREIWSSYKVKEGEKIYYTIPQKECVEAEEGDVDIIYEDEDIIAVNKPAGVLVHPTPKQRHHTLVNFLLSCSSLCEIGAPYRPGVVHRLDKDTSGIILFAKSEEAYKGLIEQFKKREVKKVYLAVVHGIFKEDEAWISAPIAKGIKNVKISSHGKDALTYFKVIKRYFKDDGYTFLEVHPITGRTHQIRVHLAFTNHPIVADPVYAKEKKTFFIKRVALHSKSLSFKHPTKQQVMEFEAPLASDIKDFLKYLENA